MTNLDISESVRSQGRVNSAYEDEGNVERVSCVPEVADEQSPSNNTWWGEMYLELSGILARQ